jgi:HEAT repeat.
VSSQETDMPHHIVQAVASRLEDNDNDVREYAVETLGNQTTLPEDILQALVSRLEDTDGRVRTFAVEAIAKQATLPAHILQGLVNRLPRLLHYQRPDAEHVLMKYDSFYANFPDFDTEILQSFYRSWVQRSFSEQISCYVHDGNLYINTSERPRIILLGSNMDRVLRAFQKEAATLGSPVCSADFQFLI